ncbi:alpha/beta hydrolase [Mycolicibacterium sp. 050232]|uniref:alpha/beta fold hydrolase n=1 Tax=Mycolicibacterium sp. 050232 TaxID=3113982 RepID=UPI002E2AF807|nr:alpha/beta hydrolase [Mycolicibacterium sp. 050232]MED5812123.1 alpha/beta hydrolase [Mycolicibacterium sp. 050232]
MFALLHGGMHRGSCWDLVREELHRLGHRTVAPDLPVDDDSAGAREWAGIADAAIESAATDADGVADVIVVAHSISGLALPVLAALRPMRRMVFVGGLLPVPGVTFADHLADNPDAVIFPEPEAGGSGPFGMTWESVRAGFYHDCPQDIARSAFAEMRAQSFTIFLEPSPLEEWPDVPSTYILLRDDRAVGASWAWRNAVRIGARLIELDGGHSPFFTRPVELAELLVDLAAE